MPLRNAAIKGYRPILSRPCPYPSLTHIRADRRSQAPLVREVLTAKGFLSLRGDSRYWSDGGEEGLAADYGPCTAEMNRLINGRPSVLIFIE